MHVFHLRRLATKCGMQCALDYGSGSSGIQGCTPLSVSSHPSQSAASETPPSGTASPPGSLSNSALQQKLNTNANCPSPLLSSEQKDWHAADSAADATFGPVSPCLTQQHGDQHAEQGASPQLGQVWPN
jgi:hypothetical protein